MMRPNFFIPGAPKSGTTALAEYLRVHPNVYICNCKEPNYFDADYPGLRRVTTEADYLALYKRANPEKHIAVGDATVMYLASEVAMSGIKAFNRDAKLVVMLRNPVDLVVSLHGQTQFGLNEDEPDLEKAWALQEERAAGRRIKPGCKEPKMLQYREVASLGTQMERLYRHFSPEQVFVVLFDEWSDDTPSTYRKVLDFLGLPDDGRTEFPVFNERRRHRFEFIGRFTQKPPRIWLNAARIAQNALGVERFGVRMALRKLNSQPLGRSPLRPEFRAQLVEVFRPEVERLEQLLDRDLSGWLAVNTSGTAPDPTPSGYATT